MSRSAVVALSIVMGIAMYLCLIAGPLLLRRAGSGIGTEKCLAIHSGTALADALAGQRYFTNESITGSTVTLSRDGEFCLLEIDDQKVITNVTPK